MLVLCGFEAGGSRSDRKRNSQVLPNLFLWAQLSLGMHSQSSRPVTPTHNISFNHSHNVQTQTPFDLPSTLEQAIQHSTPTHTTIISDQILRVSQTHNRAMKISLEASDPDFHNKVP